MNISEIWDNMTLDEKRCTILKIISYKYMMQNEEYFNKMMQGKYNNLSSYLKNEIKNIFKQEDHKGENKMDSKVLNLISRLLEEVKITMEDAGTCDHSVGLCVCHLEQLIYEIEDFLILNKKG